MSSGLIQSEAVHPPKLYPAINCSAIPLILPGLSHLSFLSVRLSLILFVL